eukprot:4543427-Prymnesium_polylepis.2
MAGRRNSVRSRHSTRHQLARCSSTEAHGTRHQLTRSFGSEVHSTCDQISRSFGGDLHSSGGAVTMRAVTRVQRSTCHRIQNWTVYARSRSSQQGRRRCALLESAGMSVWPRRSRQLSAWRLWQLSCDSACLSNRLALGGAAGAAGGAAGGGALACRPAMEQALPPASHAKCFHSSVDELRLDAKHAPCRCSVPHGGETQRWRARIRRSTKALT